MDYLYAAKSPYLGLLLQIRAKIPVSAGFWCGVRLNPKFAGNFIIQCFNCVGSLIQLQAETMAFANFRSTHT